MKPVLEIIVERGEYSLNSNLEKTFEIVKWKRKKSKIMQIQLLFIKADEVSSNEALESLKIVFWG